MNGIPRILVLDTTHQLGDLVRAAMSMLDRRYILVEYPTPHEALEEVTRTEVHLAVMAEMLDESMNAVEWAQRAIRVQAGTPIIIVAPEDSQSHQQVRLERLPFQVVPSNSGERFLRAIRVGLDGVDIVEAEEGTSSSHLELGPIPTLDLPTARQILERTRLDLGAIGGLISDRVGHIVVDEGSTGYIDKAHVAAVLGPSFAQGIEIAPQIGGYEWSMKFFEGERYNLFALPIGYHYFVLFLMDPNDRQALGAVSRFGRQGVTKLLNLLGDSAWAYKSPIEEIPEEESTPAVADKKATAEYRAVHEPSLEDISSKLFEDKLEPVADLDLDLIFSQKPDENAMDDLLRMDETAFSLGNLLEDDSAVSYEEAQNMGLHTLGE